ncbi:unnamed protein product [Medioppia subpectinata]|uniref:t-SNARE coiled-coil homology domain-containing protein n=1 Tax=Medioppia subpectinata TaxID=1979941 RepID=A0A7R9KCC2_9ACAR|nr:unnamed protein product [Medioppia subpectinata]CAG2100793.1 unnamed protein product [Medioppia subpectinata]
MVKDRLHELRAAQEDTDNHVVIITENTSLRNQMDAFFQEVEVIRENIDKMFANVEEVKKIHSKILSSPTNDENMKKQLEDLMADVKRTASKVRDKLKAIEMNIEAMEKSGSMSADFRIKKIQHSMLLQKFIDVMNDYNKTQVEYREKCKDRITRQLYITGRQTTNEEVEEMLESGNPTIFTQGIITDTQQAKQSLADIQARHADIIKLENNTQQAKQSLADIQARHADIIKLENSIREMHDMFIDMALLIENQGEIIDRIETQVVTSREYVEDGKQETKKALAFQSKSRKKCIFIVIILILLAVVITCLIVFLS